MAINSIVDTDHADEKTVAFPWIGVAESGLTILFSAPHCGVVMKQGTTSHKPGYYSEKWWTAIYIPLPEGQSIILSNKWEYTNGDA